MKKFLQDFKAFAMKGNVLDMAVGVVIGGAFGKIVSSLVADIVTPLISLLTGAVSLTGLKWVLKEQVIEAGNIVQEEIALTYGAFLQSVIDFLIIALSIFMVLRIIMKLHEKFENIRKKEAEAEKEKNEKKEEEKQDTQLSVLLEIRELLKKDGVSTEQSSDING